MKSLFEQNIQILSGKNSELAGKLATVPSDHIQILESKTGDHVPCIPAEQGRRLFIHSRIDPVREAERFISEIDITGKDLIIILGFGFGYHFDALLKNISGSVNVIALEKDYAMLKKAMECRDLTGLLDRENFFILADPSENYLSDFFRGKSSREVIFITHRGSAQIYPGYYQNMLSVIKSYISTKDVNIATLARFEKSWVSNISRNAAVISGSCGSDIFFNKFTGIPAIIVAAGPSLDFSLEFIKRNTDRAVIIAVDTSYKILANNGIVPHFCLSVDPQLINARYFEGIDKTETVLVSDPAVHPSTFRFFKGRITVTGIAFDMMKWIEDICGRKGELTHGGSVSTTAYDFAKRLGASPVIMVGQDLSFTNWLAHAKGSYLDEQIHNKTYRFNNAQMFNRRQLTFLPPVFVKGVRGVKARTNQKMMIFQNWFEKRNDSELINASYNGVFINGVKNIPHDKLEFEYPVSDPAARINELYESSETGSDKGRVAKLYKRIDEMLVEIEQLLPSLEKAVSYAQELSVMINSGKDRSDPGKVSFILKKLSEADKFVESMNKSKGLISFSIQKVIHTITEGYELNPEKEDNAAERSVFLYSGLVEGTLFNKKVLEKMKKMI